jgi:hypothetical protein
MGGGGVLERECLGGFCCIIYMVLTLPKKHSDFIVPSAVALLNSRKLEHFRGFCFPSSDFRGFPFYIIKRGAPRL